MRAAFQRKFPDWIEFVATQAELIRSEGIRVLGHPVRLVPGAFDASDGLALGHALPTGVACARRELLEQVARSLAEHYHLLDHFRLGSTVGQPSAYYVASNLN